MAFDYKSNNKPNRNWGTKTGYYEPINPEKYGNKKDPRIIYRSSLEYKFCLICDKSPKIIKWVSEPTNLEIYYTNPFKESGKAQYFPDYYVEMIVDGKIKKYIIEVKPISQLKRPEPLSKYASKRQTITYNQKLKTFIVNMQKFKAANMLCNQYGWKYIFLTEDFFKGFAV